MQLQQQCLDLKLQCSSSLISFIEALVSAASPTPISLPSAVCLSCLCGNHIWRWLGPCHWFRCQHLSHTCLLAVALLGLQKEASSVDSVTGWFFSLSWHSDPWPGYHLLTLGLPPHLTLQCWWFWFSVPRLTKLHLCMITATLVTVGHSYVFQSGILWEHAGDLTVRRVCGWLEWKMSLGKVI